MTRAGLFLVAATALLRADDVPRWAFPGVAAREPADSGRLHRIPGSSRTFTLRQVTDLFAPPDWHPAGHPAAPAVVTSGRRPNLWACGYCHLINGMGRPENAALAGLPEQYIVAQIAAFRDSSRRGALSGYRPGEVMHIVARNATEADVAAAASYFSRIPFAPRVRVVETATVPRLREAAYVYVRANDGGKEPLGRRILEGPPDFERHELRDDAMGYVAYVPLGSIERGKRLATIGADGIATACITCHGPDLGGVGVIPPIAGRYPTYLLRQLIGFKNGARSSTSSVPMQGVVAHLSLDDMIAVAAYAASVQPRKPKR